ncbi:MAG: GNAT family N-acetyltransferase [Desulfobacterales bacterium]|nr:GNAT family N-acetyltransferase [Desulfobacterales bacterium]
MDQSKITIRRAGVEDADLLTDLGVKTFMEAFGSRMAASDIRAHVAATYSEERLASELAEPRSIFLIASVAGEIAGEIGEEIGEEIGGYARMRPDARPDCIEDPAALELVRFYALKKFWGRGLGPVLMKTCRETARREGYSTMWLSSWKQNDRANAFYGKWGFEAVGEQLFVVGEDVQEDFILACALESG